MSAPKYFERWFHAKNQPILPLSEHDARVKHSAGSPYVALLNIKETKCVVDVAGDWVTVMFFDADDRLYMKYDFKRVNSGRMFLSLALHLEYEDGSNHPHTAVTFAFKTDGSIIVERRNMISGDLEEKDSHGDPASNWEVYPEFGEYSSVCRLNRVGQKGPGSD